MEEDLRVLLIGHAPLTALVPGTRIVWNHLPQSTQRPAIVLFRIAGAPGITMQGSDRLLNALVQIDIQTAAKADNDAPLRQLWNIRDVVVALLHGHRDSRFQGIVLRSERQGSEQLTGGGGSVLHRSSLDFDIWAASA